MGHEQISTSESRQRWQNKEHHFTETDVKVLRQIAKEGFQTFPELRCEILRDYSRSHSWVVMKRLVEKGYLKENRGDGGGIRGWRLSPKSQRNLQYLFDESWNSGYRPPFYRSAYDHDLLLREVKKVLSKSPLVTDWVPEHVLKARLMSRIKYLSSRDRSDNLLTIPDALFHIRSGEQLFKAALELELTRKSKKKLFAKFESHVVSDEFDFVFFVVGDEGLLKVLWNAYQVSIANSARVKVKRKQNGIYFTTLENLRKRMLDAKFSSLNGEFTFAKLST